MSWGKRGRLLLLLVVLLVVLAMTVAMFRSAVVPTGGRVDEELLRQLEEAVEELREDMERLGRSHEESAEVERRLRCKYLPTTEGCNDEGSSGEAEEQRQAQDRLDRAVGRVS